LTRVDEICTLVDPAAGGGAHTRDNLEGGVLAAAFAIIKVVEFGALHLAYGRGEAIIGGKNRRLSSEPMIYLQSIGREKKSVLGRMSRSPLRSCKEAFLKKLRDLDPQISSTGCVILTEAKKTTVQGWPLVRLAYRCEGREAVLHVAYHSY
jgi:hypothetical protein